MPDQATDAEDATLRQWRSTRRVFLAAAVALFPFLFILDERFDYAFSPVLPGIGALLVLWLLFPFAAMEARLRWSKESDPRRVQRQDRASKYVLGGAFAWFLLWLVLA